MITYVELEHCDLHDSEIEVIVLNLLNLSEQDQKTFIDNKRIRDILDDLLSYNITFRLENINMLQYTLLLTIRELDVEFIKSIGFEAIEFDNEDLNDEYDRLICRACDICKILETKYTKPNIIGIG